MKLKKLLAAVTATALAVSSMAVSSFTASAEDETTLITLYEYDASAVTIPGSVTISKSDADWSNAEKITVVVTGEKEATAEWCGYYLQETTTWKNANTNSGGTSIVDADTEDNSEKVFDNFKAAGEIKIIFQNYGELSKVTFAVDDNEPVTVYDSDNLPNGKVFPASGDLININAAKLEEYGVTAENIANCSVEITYGTTPAVGECGINVLNEWTKNIVYAKNINSASKTLSLSDITEKGYVADAIETGIMIQLKSCVVTKVVLNVPASTEDEEGSKLETDKWIEVEDDTGVWDAYINAAGDIGDGLALTANLDEGKTILDVAKITVLYDIIDAYGNKITEDVPSVNGYVGTVRDDAWVEDPIVTWDETADTFKCEFDDETQEGDIFKFQINELAKDFGIAVLFDVKYKEDNGEEEDPEPVAPVWEKVSDTEYKYVAVDDPNSEYNAKKPENMMIPFADLLADGKTAADVKSITVTMEATGSYGGRIGVGDTGAASDNWTQKDGTGAITVEILGTCQGGGVQIGLDWLNKNVTVTATVTAITDSDGNNIMKTSGGDTPEEPEPPAETGKTFEGSVTLEEGGGWYQKVISKSELIGDLDPTTVKTIVFTGANLAKVGYNSISEAGYKGIEASGTITVDASDIDFSDNYYLHVGGGAATEVTWVASAESGSTPVTPPPTGDDDNNNDDNNNDNNNNNNKTETVSTITVPTAVTNYPTVIPYGYTPATGDEIANTVSSTADGDTASVNLTSNTRVEKSVLDTIAGKDITVEFKLKGGVRWIINGKNVEKAKKVDLGVRLRGKNIPAEKIAEVAGENKTMQFSLRHNGDLGFTGTLIIPFSSSYNGKFANLYYYNKAKDELDFVGSSKISGGQASFVFTHASDYVVVIDDEAYGEDVSSAAGVYETSEETTAPYAASVAAIAVLGVAAVVIRKRLAK